MKNAIQIGKKTLPYLVGAALLASFGALTSAVAFERLPYRSGTFVGGVLFAACLWSTITDLARRKIYNVVVYPAFVLIVATNVAATFWPEIFGANVARSGGVGLGSAAFGAAICFAIAALPYVAGQGGAGDVKLAAVVGAALGLGDGVFALAAAYMFAAIFALGELARRVGVLPLCRRLWRRFFRSKSADVADEQAELFKTAIPLAPGFFASVVGVLAGLWQRLCDVPLSRL